MKAGAAERWSEASGSTTASLPCIHRRLPHDLFALVPSALSEQRHTFQMTTAEHFPDRLQPAEVLKCVSTLRLSMACIHARQCKLYVFHKAL